MTLHLESRAVAAWTFLGSLALLGFVAYMIGGYEPIFQQLSLLFTDYQTAALPLADENSLSVCIITSGLAAVLSLWSLLAIGQVIRNRPLTTLLLEQRQNFNFFHFFVLTAIEAVVARWLFLGVLPQHLHFPGAFYVCLVVGNLGWLWFRDRYFFNMPSNTLMLGPQFIAGFFYAFIFIKYGLVASYLTHLGTKSLLLSFHKVEDKCRTDKDLQMGAWSLFYGCMALGWLIGCSNKTPLAIGSWFIQTSAIEGWNQFDYLAISFAVIYLMKSAVLFLCYDQGCVQWNGKAYKQPAPYEVLIGFCTLACLVFLGCIALFFVSAPLRALALSLVVCSFYKPSSGSGRARNFWLILVILFMTFCIMDSVEWYWVPAYLGVHGLLYMPFIVMERKHVQP